MLQYQLGLVILRRYMSKLKIKLRVEHSVYCKKEVYFNVNLHIQFTIYKLRYSIHIYKLDIPTDMPFV